MFTNDFRIDNSGEYIRKYTNEHCATIYFHFHIIQSNIYISSTFATLMVSALWHGIYPGYYFCILGSPFYLPIEDLYHKLFRVNSVGMRRQLLDYLFWTSKFFAFSYMGIAFLLLTIDKIWYYYSSVYHFGYILWVVMYVGGMVYAKKFKGKSKRERLNSTALGEDARLLRQNDFKLE